MKKRKILYPIEFENVQYEKVIQDFTVFIDKCTCYLEDKFREEITQSFREENDSFSLEIQGRFLKKIIDYIEKSNLVSINLHKKINEKVLIFIEEYLIIGSEYIVAFIVSSLSYYTYKSTFSLESVIKHQGKTAISEIELLTMMNNPSLRSFVTPHISEQTYNFLEICEENFLLMKVDEESKTWKSEVGDRQYHIKIDQMFKLINLIENFAHPRLYILDCAQIMMNIMSRTLIKMIGTHPFEKEITKMQKKEELLNYEETVNWEVTNSLRVFKEQNKFFSELMLDYVQRTYYGFDEKFHEKGILSVLKVNERKKTQLFELLPLMIYRQYSGNQNQLLGLMENISDEFRADKYNLEDVKNLMETVNNRLAKKTLLLKQEKGKTNYA